jgi:ParB-like chromosome segregation protein Spo0J
MKTSKLKIKANNPRQIRDDRFEKLKKSIQEFPKMMELRPIVFDPDTMEVLGGNMRLRAIRDLGMKEIPDTWIRSADDLTEDERKRFVIQDNVSGGEWDWDIIANEWDGLPLVDWGLELPVLPEIGETVINPKSENEVHICPKCGFEFNSEK